jgi:hypothetical protein
MEAARKAGLGGPLSLDSISRRIGLARRSAIRDAAEDAWLTMRIFLWMVDHRVRVSFSPSSINRSNQRFWDCCAPFGQRAMKTASLNSLPKIATTDLSLSLIYGSSTLGGPPDWLVL